MVRLVFAMLLVGLSIGEPVHAQDVDRPVKLMTVATADNVLRRQFFGTVVARQTVDLALQVSGQIVDFPVLEGAEVAKGALIAQLDLEPFQRSLDTATVNMEQAQRSLNRLEQLTANTVSQASIDDARSAADLTEIAVRDAQYALDNATLVAPFDGLVATRNVANFETVQAGAPIVRLHDISQWRVEIDVPEILFRIAGENPDLTLTGTFSGSDRQIPLEVSEFTAEASAVGQTFKITLGMLEPPGPGVLPGTSITVIADLRTEEAGVPIPASAVVISDTGETSVMVFTPGEGDTGTLTRQVVRLTTGPDGEFLVEDGLEGGVEIVAAGAGQLTDGQTVRRFNGFAN